MALTRAEKANATMLKRYGPDFFKKRAAKGGKNSPGGFTKGSEKARLAGIKGSAARWKK